MGSGLALLFHTVASSTSSSYTYELHVVISRDDTLGGYILHILSSIRFSRFIKSYIIFIIRIMKRIQQEPSIVGIPLPPLL